MTNTIPPTDAARKQRSTDQAKRRNHGAAPASSATRRRSARATTAPASPRRPRRVVILSHGHPNESPFGGENAALQEAYALANDASSTVTFLAASTTRKLPTGKIVRLGSHPGVEEFIVAFPHSHSFDGTVDLLTEPSENILQWISLMNPHEVRIHHFYNIGIEFLIALRIRLPNTAFIYVAHEMMTICHANGQMIKERTNQLCYQASPLECATCFPQHPLDFFENRNFVFRTFLHIFDRILCPSNFLRIRLVDWGTPPEKTVYAPFLTEQIDGRAWMLPSLEKPLKIGFVGRVSPRKGILLLLDAVRFLPEHLRDRLDLRIHGLLHPNEDLDFQKVFWHRLKDLSRWVSYEGPFSRPRLHSILATLDGIVVPSLWWENAPLVITEAKQAGLPIITADIGGMKELCGNSEHDILFEFASARSLSGAFWNLLAAGMNANGADLASFPK